MSSTAHSNNRLSMRNRIGPLRAKVDENAASRHKRQASITTGGITRASSSMGSVAALKNGLQRAALGEVTTTAINRKELGNKLTGKDKDTTETGLKPSRTSSVFGVRVPLGPGKAPAAQAVAPIAQQTRPAATRRSTAPLRPIQRVSIHKDPVVVIQDDNKDKYDVMDVEELKPTPEPIVVEPEVEVSQQEVEAMVDDTDDYLEEVEVEAAAIDDEPRGPRIWPDLGTTRAHKFHSEVERIRETFHDEVDPLDTTMVSEYANEIFDYMQELEEDCMPNPDYMDGQSEINWTMRQTLVDWLLQVHLRYHMLPETLWIAVNIVDRFLSHRIVSLGKLQLVGVTAMFIAAKYEEILAPSVEEFVFMTEKGYTKEEILKGERIVLQTLDFKVSQYCSPYSWMRKISKADDYELHTRTLSKFLIEVTLLDYRFLRVKPSMLAAIGMYTARRMLGADWNENFVYYSGFTEEHLLPGHAMLIQKLVEVDFQKQYVCKKYSNRKFLRASIYAIDYARNNFEEDGNMDGMILSE